MTSYLSVDRVSKSYGARVALRDLSLRVSAGEIVGLLGPNGSGKTTLVKIAATLLARDSGRVEVLGQDLDARPQTIRHLIGYVGQDTERSAYARLTVRENLRFFAALRGLPGREADARIATLAASLEFGAELDRLFMTLSGGQKQTVVIIRALLTDPPLVYLDEPTKGLDPFMARRVRTFLARLVADGRRAVLLTSHALSEVDELAHRVVLIHEGALVADGTAAELKARTGLQGIVELPSGVATPAIEETLARAGARRRPEGPPGWVSFGVDTGATAFTGTMRALTQHRLERQYRYRPVSLEDAFAHHIGRVAERFDA